MLLAHHTWELTPVRGAADEQIFATAYDTAMKEENALFIAVWDGLEPRRAPRPTRAAEHVLSTVGPGRRRPGLARSTPLHSLERKWPHRGRGWRHRQPPATLGRPVAGTMVAQRPPVLTARASGQGSTQILRGLVEGKAAPAVGNTLTSAGPSRGADQPARNVSVLVNMVAGANSVIAVGNYERSAAGKVTPHQKYGRKMFASAHLFQIPDDVHVAVGQHREAAGTEQVLRLADRVRVPP